MNIRPLKVKDYDTLLALWERAGLESLRPQGRDSREAFAQQLAGGVQTVLGLEQDGQLVGAIVATHDGRKGWINRLVVDVAHRRQGHGQRLITAAEAVLKEQGMRVIACLIEDWNEASLALFKKEDYLLDDHVFYLSKRDSAEA